MIRKHFIDFKLTSVKYTNKIIVISMQAPTGPKIEREDMPNIFSCEY